ncbi:MAG: type II/IV secretion system protein [Rhodocyclales bacterium]|nr:type II/IV secretion system protein [Rhodocyclales bacterium]
MMELTAERVAAVREIARRNGRGFIDALEAEAALAPTVALAATAAYFRYRALDMAELDALAPAFDLVPLREAVARQCLLLRAAGGRLVAVFADPTAPAVQAWAEAQAGCALDWRLMHPADLQAALNRHEEGLHALDTALDAQPAAVAEGAVAEISLSSIGADASPVIRLVNSTLYDAIKIGASDIHFESHAKGMTVKYRVDGVLAVAAEAPGPAQAEEVISRIKVLAELDIGERRVPQDGRFKVRVRGREVDYRVSIMPSVYGEDAVVRILDKEALTGERAALSLDSLGFDAGALRVLRRLAAEPYGLLLVTGPTGSGKTTTLYAALSEINRGEEKIVTIEDPVEYLLPGVLQIPVNEKKGLSFARGLRSILRHDPDKIMVGEIRDPETAEIAVQSALTGHLVLTTVHANNVFDVIGRFTHMGVDPYSFVSALNGIVAQRLVRLVCRHCAAPAVPTDELLAASGIAAADRAGYRFTAGRGCGQCRGTGYRGRKAIAETMVVNDELRELIVARSSIRELKAAAMRHGTRSLREAGLAAVRASETTLDEINRVTFVEQA